MSFNLDCWGADSILLNWDPLCFPQLSITMSSKILSHKSQRRVEKAERKAVADRVRTLTSRLATPTFTTIAFTPMSESPMSESSSLASVISNQMWKADDGTPLALFHKKFWGKSMKDEESEWRKSQIRIAQDEDEIMDKDDDIISGCYILNISIPRMLVSHLWIRADYICVFNFFQAFFNTHAKPMAKVPSGVLTRQPGIGESSLIALLA